jgi:glycogen operon protein
MDKELLAFVRQIISLRQNHPVFHRRNFFQGRAIKGAGVKDILWLKPDGSEMTDEEWGRESARSLGVFLAGEGLEEQDERGQPVTDQNFLLLMNAHHENVSFQLPTVASGMVWVALIDTSCQTSRVTGLLYDAGRTYELQARSLALLVERQRDQVRDKDRRHES